MCFVVFEVYEEQGAVSVIGWSLILIDRVRDLYAYACLLVVDQPRVELRLLSSVLLSN